MANVEIFWDESVWIKVATKHDSYYVCTIYRPPSSDIEFWDLLDRNLEFISEISNNIIVVGDINEDQLNVRNHKLKRYYACKYYEKCYCLTHTHN